MATAAVIGSGVWLAKGVHQHVWNWSTTATGAGNPINNPMLPDKTVQIWYPTSGATPISHIVIEGSNATGLPAAELGATEWFTLTSPTDGDLDTPNALNGSGALKIIRENPRWIRPRVSSITGAAKVIIISR